MPSSSLPRSIPSSAQEPVTQKLVRCEMRHPNGKASTRFTSLDVFLLWAHMMRTRHNMECKEFSICLWLPAEEFENKAGVFSHSGKLEKVNRFDFSLLDDTYNYTYRATRYVLDSDSARFRQAMLSHTPQELSVNGRLEVAHTPGYCIEKETATNGDQLVLGLFSGLDDIY